jgi:cell division septum initiation protein DivIVA
MDILHLVDRLEELFNDCFAIPLTNNVIVNEDRMLEIIDQMRISIPDEVKNAQQVIAQRDRVLAQAQEEAQRTVKLAKDKGEDIIARDAIVEAAQSRADQIIAQARVEVEKIHIEAELSNLINQARNGIAKLTAERQGFGGDFEESVEESESAAEE